MYIYIYQHEFTRGYLLSTHGFTSFWRAPLSASPRQGLDGHHALHGHGLGLLRQPYDHHQSQRLQDAFMALSGRWWVDVDGIFLAGWWMLVVCSHEIRLESGDMSKLARCMGYHLYIWLVVSGTGLLFHSVGNGRIIPIDELIFREGFSQPATR